MSAMMQERVIDHLDEDRDPRSDGLTLRQLEQFTMQVRDQPDWRSLADKCCDYYDNNQLDPDTLATLTERGMGPLTRNLIASTVNLVLGIEAQNKRDWRVEADTDDELETAEGLSSLLHESERETRADRAVSDAFASMVKCGLGWVEVGKNADPFQYPDFVSPVHRREIWWDWFAKKPDLNDAGYLIRRRWYDAEYLKAAMPKWKWVFSSAMDNWGRLWLDAAETQPYLMEARDQAARTSLSDLEWLDRTKRRICLHEVWHRVHIRGHVLRLPGDRTVELDLKNPVHVLAINQGFKPEPALYSKWRLSLWAGPYRISDTADVPNRLPYVPFWGFREDLTGNPYGIIRGMISQQDEINARRQMMMWLLSSVMVEMDADALDPNSNTVEDVLKEIGRPDAVVVLNPQRINKSGGFKVVRNAQLANQQFQIMQDAQQGLQDVAGVYGQMLGDSGGVTAGVAISQLINQGTTGLAELLDNYTYARRSVGDRKLDNIRERIKGRPVEVVVGESGKKRTIIVLNQPTVDPQTHLIYLKNDTERSKVKVSLEDVPSTPTYQSQQQTMMAEMIKGLPPQLQAVMAPYWVELSDNPKKHEIAALMRKVLGIEDPGAGEEDPEKAELRAQVEQLMAAIQQLQEDPELARKKADAEHKQAQTEHTRAQTDKLKLDTIAQINRPPEPTQPPADP
jgi:hypothetical protein